MVGGETTSNLLDPTHVKLDGKDGFDVTKCNNGNGKNFGERKYAVGDFIDNHFVICGGKGHKYGDRKHCDVFGDSGSKTIDLQEKGRNLASYVKLNESVLWITGGKDKDWSYLSSTELITLDGSIKGIELPMTFYAHCMVMYKPGKMIIIGGKQGYHSGSDKTWIVSVEDGFNLTAGPTLNTGRSFHSCGKLKDEYGNVLIMVAGGLTNTVEYLNASTMENWVYGKTLCNSKS